MDLQNFFAENPRVALAFSGGVDSSFLLWAAVRQAERVKAYYVRSAFQPQFELDDALRLAHSLGVEPEILDVGILDDGTVVSNPPDRCYYCKRRIFSTILAAARRDGLDTVLDGTNASDDASDRPGMRALRELGVRSPLRECGLTKPEIRRLSEEAGLFTFDKPAYACLATRIPAGERITAEKLRRTEAAERYLFSLGLRDFRVRSMGDTAKLQVPADGLATVLAHREEILIRLKHDYSGVLLDLEVRK